MSYRAARNATALTLALALAAPRTAHAQRAVEAPAAPPALAPRCTLRARPLAPDTAASAPDPRSAPVVVATDEGFLVLYRALNGPRVLVRLTAGLTRAGTDREVAGVGGPFALAAGNHGAAAALIEQTPRGQALVLARFSPTGEARNVPRELAVAPSLNAVALAWTGAGYAVAWSTPSDGTAALLTDARGIPRGEPRRVLDGALTGMAYARDVDSVAVAAVANGAAEGSVALLDAEGGVAESWRWPASAHGPLAATNGASVLGLAVDPPAGLTLARWLFAAPPSETAAPLRLALGATLVSMAPDRGGVSALLDEPSGRELLVRVTTDGAAVLLAVRPGTLGALALGSDGTYLLVGHEPPPSGAGRLALVTAVCPRAPAVSAPSSAPTASAPASVGSPPDASAPDAR